MRVHQKQVSFFDEEERFKIDKPIRLISLFSGYDSQALALKYLGVPFEHYHTCEWAVPSIQALHDLHFDYDNGEYSTGLTKADLVEILYRKGISADWNKPLTKEQIARYSEEKLRTIYNNIIATKNLVSITNIHGADLEIKDTDKYCYIMTYSYPCQDLSTAGKRAGMEKGSGTRSSLVWDVGRLLAETDELPQVLVMENVRGVFSEKDVDDFTKWIAFLDSKGYTSKYTIMNAIEYGIPQNRERVFMISVLGKGYISLPNIIRPRINMSDIVEKEVDDKFWLKDATIDYFEQHSKESKEKGNGFRFSPVDVDNIGGGY